MAHPLEAFYRPFGLTRPNLGCNRHIFGLGMIHMFEIHS